MVPSAKQPNTARVSVVVPSYNHSRFVEQCLRSVFRQTLAPARLLVIDDGSTDDSVEMIEKVLGECPFECELVVRENRGLCRTLNEAIGLVDGEFFAYLGSDDLWLPEMLERQTSLLKARPEAALAFSHAYVIDDDGNIFDRTDNWSAFSDGEMVETLVGGNVFSSPGVVYRRNVLPERPWNEASILEDYELYLRLALRYEFARNSDVLCGWRQHGRNVSADIGAMTDEWIAAQDRVADQLPYSSDELKTKQAQLRYNAARGLIRGGERRAALDNLRQNRRQVSAGRYASDLFRLAVPPAVFAANRSRKRRTAIARYGNISQYL